MVRNYKRKTKRGEYGLGTLEIALTKVRSGEISKRKAEQIYKVPRKTLTRNLKGLVASPAGPALAQMAPQAKHTFGAL